jgi:hypothetical protein
VDDGPLSWSDLDTIGRFYEANYAKNPEGTESVLKEAREWAIKEIKDGADDIVAVAPALYRSRELAGDEFLIATIC